MDVPFDWMLLEDCLWRWLRCCARDGLLQERECSRSNSGFVISLEKNCVKWLSLGLTGVLLISFLNQII